MLLLLLLFVTDTSLSLPALASMPESRETWIEEAFRTFRIPAVLLVLKGLNWGGIGGKLGLNRRGNPECPECLFDPRLSRLGHGGEGRVAPGAARGRIAGVSRQG